MTRIDHDVATAEKTLQVAVGDSSLGPILVASSEKGVSASLFGSDRGALLSELRTEFPHAGFVEVEDPSEVFAKVVRLVEQPSRGFDLPLDIIGTGFSAARARGDRGDPGGRDGKLAPRSPAGSARPMPSARWPGLVALTGWRWRSLPGSAAQ